MMMQQILFHFIVVSTQGSLNKSCNFLTKKKWKKCKCYGSVFPCKAVWKSSFEDFISCHWQSKKIKCYIKKPAWIHGAYFMDTISTSFHGMWWKYCIVVLISKLTNWSRLRGGGRIGYYYGVMDKTWPLKKHILMLLYTHAFSSPRVPKRIHPCELRLQFFSGLNEFSGVYYNIPDIFSRPISWTLLYFIFWDMMEMWYCPSDFQFGPG